MKDRRHSPGLRWFEAPSSGSTPSGQIGAQVSRVYGLRRIREVSSAVLPRLWSAVAPAGSLVLVLAALLGLAAARPALAAGNETLRAVRAHQQGDLATRVVLEVSGLPAETFQDRLHDPERFFLDLLRTTPQVEGRRNFATSLPTGPVARIRLGEWKPGITRIVLDLRSTLATVNVERLHNPERVIISIAMPGAPAGTDAPSGTSTQPTTSSSPALTDPPSAEPSGAAVPSKTAELKSPAPKSLEPTPGNRPLLTATSESSRSAAEPAPARKRIKRRGKWVTLWSPDGLPPVRVATVAASARPFPAPPSLFASAAAASSLSANAPTWLLARYGLPKLPRPSLQLAQNGTRRNTPAASSTSPQTTSPQLTAPKPTAEKPALEKPIGPELPANSEARATPRGPSGNGPAGSSERARTCANCRSEADISSLTRTLGLKIRRVVLDPGHGGYDAGSSGPTGLQEKELVLDISKRLGELLERQLHAEVIYTREDDRFIPLEQRAKIANDKHADLFLSIHANSSEYRSVSGIETFYLSFTSSKEALETAARENATSEMSVGELRDIVRKIAMNEKLQESRQFAEKINTSMLRVWRTEDRKARNRGVKKAPFVVLIGANMPAVLAEVGFLSNPRDEKELKKSEVRQKIAEALYRGIASYADALGGLQVAARDEDDE